MSVNSASTGGLQGFLEYPGADCKPKELIAYSLRKLLDSAVRTESGLSIVNKKGNGLVGI